MCISLIKMVSLVNKRLFLIFGLLFISGQIMPMALLKKRELSKELSAAIEQEKEKLAVQKASGSPKVTPSGAGGDEYTQSEAHMQLDAVKEEMAKFPMKPEAEGVEIKIASKTPNEMVTPYLNIVSAVVNKEVEFKNSHDVFYHGHTNGWIVPQDLYKQLYAYYKPLQPVKDFVFLRFTDCPSGKAQDYLAENVAKWAGVSDNAQEVRDVLLPVNLALFGNVGFPGECTWNYFLENKSHRWPMANNYQELLNAFGLSYDVKVLTKEADELVKMLNETDEQTLLQIFVPQSKVDDIAYLAWVIGFPAHPKSMELAEEIIQRRMEQKHLPRIGKVTGPAVRELMENYRKGGENNPIYQELIKAVDNGDFGVSAYLDTYRTDPWKLDNPNDVQARLLITPEVLQNPSSGVKFFRYTTTPRKTQETYIAKLNALVKKIIAQEENKTAEQKIADKAKNIKRIATFKAEQEAAKK